MKKVTPEKITKLTKGQIMVFGSNMTGSHDGGAAKTALDNFGAVYGQPLGLQGQSYAVPTLDENRKQLSLERIQLSVNELAIACTNYPKSIFLITEVGCGIAGFTPEQIAPLFREFMAIDNCTLPQSFIDILNKTVVVKGFKAFDKGMKCRDFQYAENTVYETEKAIKPCESGFHFCKLPLDVLNYYSPLSEFAEVEALGNVIDHEDKSVTSKLKINSKISFGKLFKLHFDLVFDKVKVSKETTNTAGYNAHANTAGNYAHANTAGNYAHANTAGNNAHANTAGNYAHANTAGYNAHANTAGNYAIACSLGYQSKAKAVKGWIVIVDWQDGVIKNIHSAKVGGKILRTKIKSDVYYWFENGKLMSEE
jgi:hypothetical protein